MADRIAFRSIELMEAEGVTAKIRIERLLAVAVAQIQAHEGPEQAARVLRAWAALLEAPDTDPDPDPKPETETETGTNDHG